MAKRHQQLEDSLRLHQFRHDAEDEVNWIRERRPLASSSDLGHTLTQVQNLQKKHSVLETELSSHVTVIESVTGTAQELIASRHYASLQIQEQRGVLLEAWASLQEMVATRSQMLSDSLHVQQVNTIYKQKLYACNHAETSSKFSKLREVWVILLLLELISVYSIWYPLIYLSMLHCCEGRMENLML